jgi:hypothetical protein
MRVVAFTTKKEAERLAKVISGSVIVFELKKPKKKPKKKK